MATANTKRNTNALVSDLYTTPEWATAALLKRETFEGKIVDAGCGKGDISKVLKVTGHNDIRSIDLYDWGFGETGIDYIEFDIETENTIMNPPFSILSEFINKALKTSSKKVAVFSRISCLESAGRYNDIYKDNQPTRVYVFVNRVKCNKGGNDDGQASAVFYCWQVWDLEDKSGKTELIWLDDKEPKKQKQENIAGAPAIHFSDVKTLLDESLAAYRSVTRGEDVQNIVSVSGGKDSTITKAICNIATEGNYRAICCDTDNEHPDTYKYIKDLHNNIGGTAQPVEMYKLEIPKSRFEERRNLIRDKWTKPHTIRQGVFKGQVIPPMTDEQIELAISLTIPSGNSFLDLCVIHGGMPTRQARFCTEELKIQVSQQKVLDIALSEFDGEVINWSGVRSEESEKRSKYKWYSEDPRGDGFLFTFLPVHKFTEVDIFAMHKYLGIKPNPLYLKGAKRVGCWPCIMSNKEEIRQFSQDENQVKRIDSWEKIITRVSRYALWRAEREGIDIGEFRNSFIQPSSLGVGFGVHDVIKWSMTDRKGDAIEYDSSLMNCQLGDHKFCE